MIDIKRNEECCGCNACGDICPKEAIKFQIDQEGFWYPSVNIDKCVNCGLCEKICPQIHDDNARMQNYQEPECYVAEHKSIDVVFSSTTGGVFSALAEIMYAQGGYVGGAVHNDDFSVSEFISNKKEDLKLLRRSKDLQSDSSGFYKKVKKLLNEGENVLVCALPCQIAALKCFMGKDYPNLVTVDLICLGVNSPKVWRKYLDGVERKNGAKLAWTENKSKEYGWHNLTQKFVFDNGAEYFETATTSPFIKGFIKSHIYCRPSCYECKFKGFPRNADISVGDFWGIETHDKEFNSNMGTSVVLVNSQKGRDFFERTKKRIKYKSVPLEWAVSGNPALTRPISRLSDKRKEFFDDLDKLPFEETVKKYNISAKLTVKNRLKKVKKALGFCKYIIRLTRFSPRAIYQTIKYSGIKNLIHRKGIVCAKNCVVNIDKSSKLCFNGLLIVGSKGHFSQSKSESRLFVGKNAALYVYGDFTVEHNCDIEVFDNAELIIHGKKLGVSDANEGLTIICGEKIEIGADVGIGRNVMIRDTNGNHFMNTTGYRPTRPVYINEKAWLCESCTIMPGVKIGRGAIIGVNSTVMRSVPDHALASGFPATVVQENVLWKC